MISLNQKGTVLLYAVIAMTAISVLGTGIYFLTSTSTFSGLRTNQQNRAYQLALAGKDYALTRPSLGNDVASKYPNGFTFTNGDKFRLVISGDTITSTGIVNENTPYEARRTITVTKTGFGSQAGVSFVQDIAAMGIIKPTSAPADFISKTDSALLLGKVGASYQSQFGAVVYSGNAVQGNCLAGKCDFGTGFNAFFVFQFGASSTGDGFTFAFFNGSNNQASSVGGYSGYGELMGYAGDSFVSGTYFLDGLGLGIQPPKVAVEFDPYENASNPVNGCPPGRNDGSLNHMALVFWGDNTRSCASTFGKYTFDDNLHGAGTGGSEDPKNGLRASQSGGDACSYFNGVNLCGGGTLSWSNWLLNWPSNVYALRMEARRKLTPEVVSGNYQYRFKVWIKRCTSDSPTCASDYAEDADYLNTKKDYTADNPYLDRTIEISPAYHVKFETILFGWTTATGSATQNVNINRFKMNFLK
jgi:hypothetical protein